MKRIQRLIATSVLTMALALCAVAGDMPAPGATGHIPGPGVVEPSPSPSTTVTGEMTTGVTATDPGTDFLLSLVQSLLSLF